MINITYTESLFLEQLLEDIHDEHSMGEYAPLFDDDIDSRLKQGIEILKGLNTYYEKSHGNG